MRGAGTLGQLPCLRCQQRVHRASYGAPYVPALGLRPRALSSKIGHSGQDMKELKETCVLLVASLDLLATHWTWSDEAHLCPLGRPARACEP